uniref:Uncharacterized protein n=1 Tax=Cannabis sativa TaxID=3483 RepID=A0A803NSP6_CANSA
MEEEVFQTIEEAIVEIPLHGQQTQGSYNTSRDDANNHRGRGHPRRGRWTTKTYLSIVPKVKSCCSSMLLQFDKSFLGPTSFNTPPSIPLAEHLYKP